MKPLLNTLFVTLPTAQLSYSNHAVVVKEKGRVLQRIPLHNLEQITTFNYGAVSAPLMYECSKRNIALTFHSPNGKFLARVIGPVSGNVLVRKAQILQTEQPVYKLQLAKQFISSKLTNQRTFLAQHVKNTTDKTQQQFLKNIMYKLDQQLVSIEAADSLQQLLGLEGASAAFYFSTFNTLIHSNDPALQFQGRTRRPPKDPVNALLSFGYTLLKNDMMAALESCGLDPYIGYLHELKPGKPSLALDMMEPLRPIFVDRLVIKCLNKKMLTAQHFQVTEEQILLTAEGKKIFLAAWQHEKTKRIYDEELGVHTVFGLIPYLQATRLNQWLRHERSHYTPYTWEV